MSSLLDTQNVSETTTLTASQVAKAVSVVDTLRIAENIVDILRQFQVIPVPSFNAPINIEDFEVIVIDGNCIGTLSLEEDVRVHVYESGIDFDAMTKPIKDIGSDVCSNRALPSLAPFFSALKTKFRPECILIVRRNTGKCAAYQASESFLARLNEGEDVPFVTLP